MKNKQTKKKRLFGRNLFTLLFTLVVLIVLFFAIYSPITYSNVYNKNKVNPFVSTEENSLSIKLPDEEYDEKYTHINYIKQEDFTEFDLNFTCTEYTEANGTAVFELTAKPNQRTEELKAKNTNFTINACLAANWVKFETYSSSYSGGSQSKSTLRTTDLKDEKGKTLKLYFKNIIDFPAKAEGCFPVPVKVDSANCYLYINYEEQVSGKTHSYYYIIEYTYHEYHTNQTVGSR